MEKSVTLNPQALLRDAFGSYAHPWDESHGCRHFSRYARDFQMKDTYDAQKRGSHSLFNSTAGSGYVAMTTHGR